MMPLIVAELFILFYHTHTLVVAIYDDDVIGLRVIYYAY